MNYDDIAPFIDTHPEKVVEALVADTTQICLQVHQALAPFSVQGQAIRDNHPAYSRVLNLFVRQCEQKFNTATRKANQALQMAKTSGFSLSKAIQYNARAQEEIMQIVKALSTENGRSHNDIVSDFAQSIAQYAKHGYVPAVTEVNRSDKELAIMISENMFKIMNAKLPQMHSFYRPCKGSLYHSVLDMEDLLKSDKNIFLMADGLMQLMTTANHLIMAKLSQA